MMRAKIARPTKLPDPVSGNIERPAMDAHFEQLQRADSSDEDFSNALVQRIRKLRWMGMEDEAEGLQAMLRQIRPADILLSDPSDTD